MSAKAIREATGKDLLNRWLKGSANTSRFVVVNENTNFNDLVVQNPWLKQESLVVKPDQLIKRRGKLGLILVNADIEGVKKWVSERMAKDIQIGKASGKLRHFIIEPFLPHKQEEEAYICIYSHRLGDTILFHHEGGVDIGDVESKALKLEIPIDGELSESQVKTELLKNISSDRLEIVTKFVLDLYRVYVDLYFTYLEINPLVITKSSVNILDLAAKLDSTAEFICKQKWGEFEFPPPFGRDAFPEEAYIADLDAKSGASLKLTILNKNGRIWTMVAGGGASVIYADTICELGGAAELANYGEYSGAPSEQQTYEYAKTILSLMTKEKHPNGKLLLIGGGIANFTNVAATFKGIVKALREFQTRLIEHSVQIFVRRAGPNFQEGLRAIRETGSTLGVPVHVFGPETHMTAIVAMALQKKEIPELPESKVTTANFLLPGNMNGNNGNNCDPKDNSSQKNLNGPHSDSNAGAVNTNSGDTSQPLFSPTTKAIVWGMQTRAVQSMLDFDFVCSRKEWSVVALVYPFTGDHKQKFYWGLSLIHI